MKKNREPKWMTWRRRYKGRALAALDIEILKFLWKWKLSPVRVLHQALGPEINPNTFNKRIKKLEKNQLIQSRWDVGSGFHVWELGEFGFYVIREGLGEIKDHGFHSASPPHDRLVLAFQLGEWLWQRDSKPVLITEQELMKYPKDIMTNLVPDSEDHRPDGYTLKFDGDTKKIFAIEVELHAKSVSRYHTTIRWYDLKKEITQVLWLVGEPFVKEQILRAKSEARETSSNYHLFVDLRDYLKNGWNAMVRNESDMEYKILGGFWRGTKGPGLGEYVGSDGTQEKIDTFTDHRKFLKTS